MAGRFLLDTHVPVDVSGPAGWQRLPLKVRRILEDPNADLLLSVVSQVEVAIKSSLGKLDLQREELALICANASISFYPLRTHHADRLFELPPHHKDPFDRLIIATALSDDLTLISRDPQFRKYKGLKVVW
jgi:PIN domain nuclease of toxin-antitoxin system